MTADSKKYNKWIVILSITIPLVVAILFGVKIDTELPVFLPPIYATINGLTSLLLIAAVWAIKNKKVELHEKLMKTAIVFCNEYKLLLCTISKIDTKHRFYIVFS